MLCQQIFTISSILMLISKVGGENVDCHGKGFLCNNSTHFFVCVDMGNGLTQTVDNIAQQCPQDTFCNVDNVYECMEVISFSPIGPEDAENIMVSTVYRQVPSNNEVVVPFGNDSATVPIEEANFTPSSVVDSVPTVYEKSTVLSTTLPATSTMTEEIQENSPTVVFLQNTPMMTVSDIIISTNNGDTTPIDNIPTLLTVPISTITSEDDSGTSSISSTIPISTPEVGESTIIYLPSTIAEELSEPSIFTEYSTPKTSYAPATSTTDVPEIGTNTINEVSSTTPLESDHKTLTSAQPALVSFSSNAIPEVASTLEHAIYIRTIQPIEILPSTNAGISLINSNIVSQPVFSPTPIPLVTVPLTISNTENVCQGAGRIPDENSCHSFYMCINNVRYKLICPFNTVYSPSLQKCTTAKDHCISVNTFICSAIGRFPDSRSCYSYFDCRTNGNGFTVTRYHCPWYSSFQPSNGQCVSSNNACGCWQTPQTCRYFTPNPSNSEAKIEDKGGVSYFFPDDPKSYGKEYILQDSYVRDNIISIENSVPVPVVRNNVTPLDRLVSYSGDVVTPSERVTPYAGIDHSSNSYQVNAVTANYNNGAANTYIRVLSNPSGTIYVGSNGVPLENIESQYIQVSPVPVKFDIGYNSLASKILESNNHETKWSQPDNKEQASNSQWTPNYYGSWFNVQ